MKGIRAQFAAPNRRSGVITVTKDRECDCCDGIKPCVSIDIGLVKFVWVICEDCLIEFTHSFRSEKEIRKLKINNINKNEY